MKEKKIIIVISLVTIATIYGFFSAYYNQNPYYSSVGSETINRQEMFKAWSWEPSPAWIPSYILCKLPCNGFGIHHTKSGYMFRTTSGRKLYFAVSTIIGLIFGVIIGTCIMVIIKIGRQASPV